MSLFVWWCMSDAPRVFDGKRALATSLFMWCLMCVRDEFAQVVHISSIPLVFNHKSVHDKSACNKEDTLHIIIFYTRKTCVCICVKFKLSCTVHILDTWFNQCNG